MHSLHQVDQGQLSVSKLGSPHGPHFMAQVTDGSEAVKQPDQEASKPRRQDEELLRSDWSTSNKLPPATAVKVDREKALQVGCRLLTNDCLCFCRLEII